eukprot:jgi/Ulvmu1/3495/UM162_0002.1
MRRPPPPSSLLPPPSSLLPPPSSLLPPRPCPSPGPLEGSPATARTTAFAPVAAAVTLCAGGLWPHLTRVAAHTSGCCIRIAADCACCLCLRVWPRAACGHSTAATAPRLDAA